MNRLLLILILTFSFQSLTKADDITDFQIEGMSIGDSALDFMTEKEIIKTLDHKHTFFYKKKVFAVITSLLKNDKYDRISITIKPNDKSFLIHGIEGIIYFNNDISGCLKKKIEAQNELKSFLKNTNYNDQEKYKHPGDPSGNSLQTVFDFNFKNGGLTRVVCHDWSEKLTNEKGWTDEFKIYIVSEVFYDFVNSDGY